MGNNSYFGGRRFTDNNGYGNQKKKKNSATSSNVLEIMGDITDLKGEIRDLSNDIGNKIAKYALMSIQEGSCDIPSINSNIIKMVEGLPLETQVVTLRNAIAYIISNM